METLLHLIPQMIKGMQIANLRSYCRRTRTLVLTYDDGPGKTFTPQVLTILKDHGVKATFFLLGSRATRAPAVIDRIVDEGHELGCHSQQHLHAWRTWPWKAVKDISQGYRSLSPWVDRQALFRPPMGKVTIPTLLSLSLRGAKLGWWTIDSLDTDTDLPEPQEVIESVSREGGGVVLMHDFDRAADCCEFVLKTTDMLLSHARTGGLNLRTLGQVLSGESAGRDGK